MPKLFAFPEWKYSNWNFLLASLAYPLLLRSLRARCKPLKTVADRQMPQCCGKSWLANCTNSVQHTPSFSSAILNTARAVVRRGWRSAPLGFCGQIRKIRRATRKVYDAEPQFPQGLCCATQFVAEFAGRNRF